MFSHELLCLQTQRLKSDKKFVCISVIRKGIGFK